ncbi:2021_t:CDS:2 [Funneliformis mosseae]|uniref:2021_t:CDS:1 n=1 Tax=Funneliformis mosseae TaxID=27381 RepID=A0A9N9GTY2_FUNMO|nr:2021_t:CDS:2 [Funneliformis mosseae]
MLPSHSSEICFGTPFTRRYNNSHNHIGYRIELVSASLESGRGFSSVTSSFLGGVKGFAIFYINDGSFSNFIISWSVPTIGSPKYEILGHDLSEYYNIVLEHDPSERRNMLHSVPNLDPPNYAPPAYSSYSSIPYRESGNRIITHSVKHF